MGKSRLRGNSPTYLSPSRRQLTPPLSIHENWDGETAMSTSRPASCAGPRAGSPSARLPTLGEILSNTAPPPWTLSAFTAYLSQNHCLETLEFLMEAERYRSAFYHQPAPIQPELVYHEDEDQSICSLWDKLIQAYITPSGPREVNLPAPVRDRLLRLSHFPSTAPDPSRLDEAVEIVRELMSDSLLVPFVQSVLPPVTSESLPVEEVSERKSRSRLRIPMDLISPSSEEGSHSPKTTFLPLLGLRRNSPEASRSASGSATEPMEVDLITDYSDSPNSTPGAEPMTPPTTPPTSDFTFSSSPNNLQRAISGGGWKKMSARLGLSRRNRSMRRSQPTNMPSTVTPLHEIPHIADASLAKSPTHKDVQDIRVPSWEDPHPGQRVEIHTGSPFGSRGSVGSGDRVGGVAAKVDGMHYYGRAPIARKNTRSRYRSSVPRAAKMSTRIYETSESFDTPLASPQLDFLSPESALQQPIGRAPRIPTPEPLKPLTLGAEPSGQTRIPTGRRMQAAERAQLEPSPSFTDLSNLLGISPTSKVYEGRSMSVMASTNYSRMNTVDDIYGWEAELDRKSQYGSANGHDAYDCDQYEYRRADGNKRSLFHRVFGVSSTKGMI
ncbi:hypothetical protein BX600DRAFT_431092 [Xylariales sp. PMI_506]|nr:hypothetical protein BX600DRAFT_431092 [Xylariales sp. PMI_506]